MLLLSSLFVGVEAGDASSGLAMRKPPSDCERLKSPSMATRNPGPWGGKLLRRAMRIQEDP